MDGFSNPTCSRWKCVRQSHGIDKRVLLRGLLSNLAHVKHLKPTRAVSPKPNPQNHHHNQSWVPRCNRVFMQKDRSSKKSKPEASSLTALCPFPSIPLHFPRKGAGAALTRAPVARMACPRKQRSLHEKKYWWFVGNKGILN